jgi:hypothetical protein
LIESIVEFSLKTSSVFVCDLPAIAGTVTSHRAPRFKILVSTEKKRSA